MSKVSYIIFQILIALLLAPLATGIINKLKAYSQHRIGPPVLQLYFNLLKLFRKDMVVSDITSWIFRFTPYIYFSTALAAFVFLPVVGHFASFGFTGDAILAVYLLAAGRFFITLAGLDTGSTFGGMGSSRELMVSSLIEPSLILVILTLSLRGTLISTDFGSIYQQTSLSGLEAFSPVHILLLVSLFIAILCETARIPVDDPATHLELTMIHEAMILEYSGKYLALIEYGSAVKQLFFMTIIANIFLPFGLNYGTGIGVAASLLVYVVKIIGISCFIAIVEINTVKLRIFSVPNLAALAFILALLGFMAGFIFGRF